MKGIIISSFCLILLSTKCQNNESNNSGNNVTGANKSGLTIEEAYEKNLQDSTLITGWYHTIDSTNAFPKDYFQSEKEPLYVDPRPIATSRNIDSFEIFQSKWSDKPQLGLGIYFDKEGTREWSIATKKASSTGNYIVFILHDTVFSALHVVGQMTNGRTAIWKEDYDQKALKNLIERIME